MENEDARLLRKTDVAQLLGCSPRQVENLVKRGSIPKPIYVCGPQSPRWRRPELLETLGLVRDSGVML
jgi:predicted DNA-binding transcriptional regulator AlpA